MQVWTRPGTKDQPPLPSPFNGVAQTFNLNVQLSDANDESIFTYSDTGKIAQLVFVVAFPSGLYAQGPQGQAIGTTCFFVVRWRPVGVTTWTAQSQSVIRAGSLQTPFLGYHAETARFTMGGGTPGGIVVPLEASGPIEIQLVRITPSLGTAGVNASVWRDLAVITPHTLRYPGDALLGLDLQAGARFSGGLPNVSIRCDLSLVRVWDATNGWSPRCWDVPAAPFDFHTHPPGRNPAWCLLDFLLAPWGLGRWLTEDRIDLPAFRAWALFCDLDPDPTTPWNEPQFTVDLVGDTPRPAWDWVLTFCAAGRATPVLRNGKLSVVYQYRDAHSDAGLTVPAKVPTQLLSSGNCEKVQVNWLQRRNRPTVYQFQFLNEDAAYGQDVYPVEDDEGTLNDPSALGKDTYRPEVVQAYGVTRESQLYREGVWRHRIQRLVRRELIATTGPWALAAEVGDLIDFENEVLRPFAADVPVAMQVITGGTTTTTLVIDHGLAGTGLQVVVRDPDGKPQRANVSSFVNSTVGGRERSTLTLATAVTCNAGAPCVVGKVSKLTETYQIVAITLQKDMKREFRALQWTPEAYNPITRSAFDGVLEAGDEGRDESLRIVDEADTDELPPSVLGIRVVAELDGSHRVTWGRPGTKSGTWARVYVRPASLGAWLLVAATELDEAPLRGLQPGTDYVVSVCLENRTGDPVPPDLGDQLAFRPEEFPPFALPAVQGVRASSLGAAMLIEWLDQGQRSLEYVEVRAGSLWTAARTLARSAAPRVEVTNPPAGVPLLLAARSVSGLYGPITALTPPAWAPPGTLIRWNEDDLAPSPAGTLTGVVWNATDGVLELADGELDGTYQTLAQDLTTQAPYYWQVRWDAQELHDILVGDLDLQLSTGDALWRQVSGRPASPASPGLDWFTRVAAIDMPVGDLPPSFRATGHLGVVGSHTQVLVESRFHVDGSWGAWAPHVDRAVVARQIQVRLSIRRRSLDYRARVRLLTIAAYL